MPADPVFDELLDQMTRNELPWDRAWVVDYSDFDGHYTLHDSCWIGIFLGVCSGNEAVLLIQWDGHWLPEPLRSLCVSHESEYPEWPFLFVRLSELKSISFQNFKEPLDGRTISHIEWDKVENAKFLETTDIYDTSR